METDIFCKIVKGEIETEFLFEDEDLIAFRDINPKAPVHYLVVPRKHIPTVHDSKDTDARLLGKMILAGQKVAEVSGISEGYKLIFNVGEKGGQEVFHIHLHVLGGWNEQVK